MKPNPEVNEFVKRLIAAFSRYPISKETGALYVEKLSPYRLSPEQWDRILNKLIDNKTSDYLPYLTEIKSYIDNLKYETADNNKGIIGYTWKGSTNNVVRVKCINGKWVDRITGLDPVYPEGATDITQVYPDKPAKPEPWEIPSDIERNEFIKQILDNVGKMGKPEDLDIPF